MIVVILSRCPPSLRGDISKWLYEVSTGVYVGNIAARVRDALWERILSSMGTGKAIMVFSADNDQRFDVRVHNTEWNLQEIDGIKVMMRQSESEPPVPAKGFSKASHMRRATNPPKRTSGHHVALMVVMSSPSVEFGKITAIEYAVINGGSVVKHGKWRDGADGPSMGDVRNAVSKAEHLVMYRAGRQIQFLRAFDICPDISADRVVDVYEVAREKLYNLDDLSIEGLCRHFGVESDWKANVISIAKIYDKLSKIC